MRFLKSAETLGDLLHKHDKKCCKLKKKMAKKVICKLRDHLDRVENFLTDH